MQSVQLIGNNIAVFPEKEMNFRRLWSCFAPPGRMRIFTIRRQSCLHVSLWGDGGYSRISEAWSLLAILPWKHSVSRAINAVESHHSKLYSVTAEKSSLLISVRQVLQYLKTMDNSAKPHSSRRSCLFCLQQMNTGGRLLPTYYRRQRVGLSSKKIGSQYSQESDSRPPDFTEALMIWRWRRQIGSTEEYTAKNRWKAPSNRLSYYRTWCRSNHQRRWW